MGKKISLSLALMVILVAVMACYTPQATSLSDKTWLSQGKIRISNLSPGKRVSEKISLHNGHEVATRYSVYYRIPDYVEAGFQSAPAEAKDWTVIAETSPRIGPQETKELQVVLDLPATVQTPRQWEFWIGVRESLGSGLTSELCSRWLITMKGG